LGRATYGGAKLNRETINKTTGQQPENNTGQPKQTFGEAERNSVKRKNRGSAGDPAKIYTRRSPEKRLEGGGVKQKKGNGEPKGRN